MISKRALERTANRALKLTHARNSLSTWKVTRPGPLVTDPITGDTSVTTTTVYEGPAFLEAGERPLQKVDDTGVSVSISGPRLCVTADVVRIQKGDTCTPVTVRDLSLVGRSWRVIDEPGTSYGIHREYPLEEVTAS